MDPNTVIHSCSLDFGERKCVAAPANKLASWVTNVTTPDTRVIDHRIHELIDPICLFKLSLGRRLSLITSNFGPAGGQQDPLVHSWKESNAAHADALQQWASLNWQIGTRGPVLP